MKDEKFALYGIIGCPVGHTLSPALHNAAFSALGMNARYVPFHVPAENLAAAVGGIRGLGIRGVNVTAPHKVSVVEHLDRLEPAAERLGAVNTIHSEDGVLVGYNTDGRGFIESLRREKVEVAGRHVVVIGAGGAARAVVHAAALEKPASITIVNRTLPKAEKLAAELSGGGTAVTAAPLDGNVDTVIGKCDICINCTPLGLRPGDPAPAPTGRVTERHVLVDLVYNPPQTRFLREGKMRGAA
ncbi:MAG: shikimate dehydrogenase, partial [bacterium]